MPIDYLDRPYFDSWAQTDFSTYIEAGWMTLEEIRAGKSLASSDEYGDPPPAQTLEEVLQEDHDHAFRFDAPVDASPVFVAGQTVRTASYGHAGHTRLPQYARDRRGTIHAHHGAHVYPDRSAEGVETHQHLYTVMFMAGELWNEAEGSKDKVYLDLWESYLGAVE